MGFDPKMRDGSQAVPGGLRKSINPHVLYRIKRIDNAFNVSLSEFILLIRPYLILLQASAGRIDGFLGGFFLRT